MGATEGLVGADWFSPDLFGGGGKGCIVECVKMRYKLGYKY